MGGGRLREERARARQHDWTVSKNTTREQMLDGRAQRRASGRAGLAWASVRSPPNLQEHYRRVPQEPTEQLAGKAAPTERAIERLEVNRQAREQCSASRGADVGRSGQIGPLSEAGRRTGDGSAGTIMILLEYGEFGCDSGPPAVETTLIVSSSGGANASASLVGAGFGSARSRRPATTARGIDAVLLRASRMRPV